MHFKNCFSGSGISIASCDGIFQLADEFKEVQEGKSYGNMSIDSSEKDKIVLKNMDDIYLKKNKDIPLMGDLWIRTANQKILATEPLRFCIYKRAFEPGIYIIRGPIAPVFNGVQSWNAEEFPGFYYDMNSNIKTENIWFSITGKNQLEKSKGVEYSTHTQELAFRFGNWGKFYVVGFLGEKYFASYAKDSYFFDKSDVGNLMIYDQLSKVLIDSTNEVTILENKGLWLEEGYILEIKSINVDGNQVMLELRKNGLLVDSKVVSPSIENATLADKTYCYTRNMGNNGNLAIIAVHFKDAFRGEKQNLSTIDGVWQISERPTDIKVGTEYGKMEITSNDNGKISMNNKYHITLSKRSQPLMENMAIGASDEDGSSGSFKKYYLYKEDTIERLYPIGPHDVIYPTKKGLE